MVSRLDLSSPIGYQILIKSETFALKQDLQYPPGGGGGGHVIIGIWEKKSGLLVSEKPKNCIWSGRRPENLGDLSTRIQSKTLFFNEKIHSQSTKCKKNPPAAGNNYEHASLSDLIMHQIPIIICSRSRQRRSC